MRAAVGEPDDPAALLGHQPGVGGEGAPDAGAELLGTRRGLLEGCRPALDVGGVDRGARLGVAVGVGVAHDRGGQAL